MHPTVIALTGLPGTGKSKLGATLYQRLPRDFAFLDIDTLTEPLVRAALAVSGMSLAAAAEDGTLRELRDAQYACLFAQVRELVSFRRNVLFVAPMTYELEAPRNFSRVADDLRPARLMLIRVRASPEIVRGRLERRGDFLDELRLSRWNADRFRYDRPPELPMPGLELDSSARTAAALADDALRWLETRRAFEQATDDALTHLAAPLRRSA